MAVPCLLLLACGSPAADDSEAIGNEKVRAAVSLQAGSYDSAMTVSVDKARGLITGIYADVLGDPAQGGAACWVYFVADAMKAKGSTMPVQIYDVGEGADSADLGEKLEIVSPTKFSLKLKPTALPAGCARFGWSPGDTVSFEESSPATEKKWAPHAMRRVSAKKAFCHDEKGVVQRPFVVAGDAFVVVDERKGMVQGVYSQPANDAETVCWFKTTDLAPLAR